MNKILRIISKLAWAIMLMASVPYSYAASPDFMNSNYLLFTSLQDGNREVYRFDPSTKELVNLSKNEAVDDSPVWSPKRRKIAFVTNRGGTLSTDGSFEIYEMNLDGTKQEYLVGGKNSQVYPMYSHDGKRLAYSSDETGDWWIYILDISTHDKTRLVRTYGETAPAWSPDDNMIVFKSGHNISVINVSTKKEKQLTDISYGNANPVFSPNGKNIAFISKRDGKESVFVMNSDGSQQTKVTSRGFIMDRGIDMYPSWSPDGEYITYYSTVESPVIFLSDLNKTQIKMINIKTKEQVELIEDKAGEGRPVWVTK